MSKLPDFLTETNNLLVTTESKPEKKETSASKSMQLLMKKMSDQIKMALPKQMASERFQRIALSTFGNNPKLQQCDPISFLSAVMQSAQLGLEPNTQLGHAYIIPYGKSAQFQLGYQGLIDLCYRTGKFKNIGAYAVHENDTFDIEYGINAKAIHKPLIRGNRGEIIGYYGFYNLTDSGEGVHYMSKAEVKEHNKKYSKNTSSNMWTNNFDSMAKKTVIKQVLKYAPKSIELQSQIAVDYSEDNILEKNIVFADQTFHVDTSTGEVIENI